MAHPDQKYIEALLNNDSHLINEIYLKFFGDIERMVKQRRGNEEAAKDLFQNALIDLFRMGKKGFTLNDDCSLRSFLSVMCRNRWINETTRPGNTNNQGLNNDINDIKVEPFIEADEILADRERIILVKKLLPNLSEQKQKLLQLRWEGFTNKQIAEQLNISEIAVRVGIHDGLKKLTVLVRKHSILNY